MLVAIWKCGCVFSEKAFQATLSKNKEAYKCLLCNESFDKQDIISLNLEQEELEFRREGLCYKIK